MRRTTSAVATVILLGLIVTIDADAAGMRSGVTVRAPRAVGGPAHVQGHGGGARVVTGHSHFHGHGFVRPFPRSFVFVNPFPYYAYPYYAAPPVAYASPPSSVYVEQYAAPQTMIGGSTYIDLSGGGGGAAGGGGMASAPSSPTVVYFPTGRYELRGDGINVPYTWVWIPNPPTAPPGAGGGVGS